MTDAKILALAGLSMTLVLLAAGRASADVVRLTSGRTIEVEHARLESDVAVLELRTGEEVRVPRELVEEIVPGDLPRGRTAALEALASSPTAAAPRLAASTVRELVDRVARRLGVDSRLAHAIVRVESNYEPLAVSARGAMGLMQIMPQLADSYDVRDPYDPEQNLEAGMRHLLELLRRFSVAKAVAAYNAGAGAVTRYGGVPPYRETQSYVRRIMTSLQ